MFTQRKTDSYDLVGTNARNSDISMNSSQQRPALNFRGNSNISFEQFDNAISQGLDFVFVPAPCFGSRQSSYQETPFKKVANNESSVFANYFQQETSDCFFLNEPFTKNRISHLAFAEFDESTEDTTGTTASSLPSPILGDRIVLQSNELQAPCNERISQLMKDLDFIDQPLIPMRLKSRQSSTQEFPPAAVAPKKANFFEDSFCSGKDEETRRRKNKHQVKFLQSEYSKNSNWDRSFMKDLAKKVGLKASQVYKWNWDQKKKEVDEEK